MDDFLTLYRQNYTWPAKGRRLVRGPRPPPDPEAIRSAIEGWEKGEGLCSASWTGSDQSNIGAEWLLAAQGRQGKPKGTEECTFQQLDRIALARLRALQLERSQLERKIIETDTGPKANRRKYTSTYQNDYTTPGVPPVDALWSFSDLIAMSRGVACEEIHDWPTPAADKSGDRCRWGERASELPRMVKLRCRQRPHHRACEGCDT